MTDIEFIGTLEAIIQDRLAGAAEDSYTSQLATAGVKRMAQKVGEEAVEVALAATAGSREELLSESADLIYHLLVLLNTQGVELADVATTLAKRHKN